MAIDLIVQHIRDFLNNRSRYGSSTSIATNCTNLDHEHGNLNGIGFRGTGTAGSGGGGTPTTAQCNVRLIPPARTNNSKHTKVNNAVYYIRPH